MSFFSEICTAKVLFKAWQPCCHWLFLHCGHGTDLPLVCVMQEGKKRMQDEGLCSPGEHHCLVLYRRTKARDDWRLCTTQISQVFVSLKSTRIFSDIFILCKLIEVPDGSSVEIIW